jgi:hypothetical protein
MRPNIFELKIGFKDGDNAIEQPRRYGSRQIRTGDCVFERAERFFQGGFVQMNRKEIIFFDELGFGWIVDKAIIKKLHSENSNEDIIVEKTLADLLRCA